jgi:hypothetical protein
MKSFTKKCRRCLWTGPDREDGLEAQGPESRLPADHLRRLLGGAGAALERPPVS